MELVRLAEEEEKRKAEEAEAKKHAAVSKPEDTPSPAPRESGEASAREKRQSPQGKDGTQGKKAQKKNAPSGKRPANGGKKPAGTKTDKPRRPSDGIFAGARSESVRRKIEAVRRKEAEEQARKESAYREREGVKEYVPPKFRGGASEYLPESGKEKKSAEGSGKGLKNQLRDQTTRVRREQKRGKRRLNMENLRRVNVKQSFRVKQEKKIDWKRYASIAGLTLLFYVLIAGAAIALYYGNLIRHAAHENETLTVWIGNEGENKATKRHIRYGDMIREDGILLNMSDIAEYCDMTVSGDIDDRRFFNRGDETNIVGLRVGSRTAVINGTPVTLRLETELWGEDLYVSADLFDKYTTGLTIDYNFERFYVDLLRVKVEGVYSKTEYVPLRFLLRPTEALGQLDFNSLDEETKLGIEQRYRGSVAKENENRED